MKELKFITLQKRCKWSIAKKKKVLILILANYLLTLLGLKKISFSASVGLEKGDILEMYSNLLPTRSPSLPVHFVLHLQPSIPMACSTLHKLAKFILSGECNYLSFLSHSLSERYGKFSPSFKQRKFIANLPSNKCFSKFSTKLN